MGDDMLEDITTDEMEKYLDENSEKRIILRIKIAQDDDFDFTKARGILKALEEKGKDDDTDIIVYSENSVVQTKILKSDKASKVRLAESVINHLHLDYIPYTYLVVSLPKTDENKDMMNDICGRFGIFL